jgi:exopolysaccharide production protein ExoZ
MQSHKSSALQAARGVAALLVVVCHVSAFVGQEPSLWHRYGIYLWLRGGALGVQLFFVLSGIVIFTAHRDDFGRPSTAPSFYWKRFRRIYPLYWIFFLLTVLSHFLTANSRPDRQSDPFVLLSGVVLIHLFSIQTNMVVAWTLFDEVLFYLVFSALLFHRKIGTILLLLWMGASLFFFAPTGTYWPALFTPNHLLFGLGILVALLLGSPPLQAPSPPQIRVETASAPESRDATYAKVLCWIGILVFAACVILAGPFEREISVRLAAGVGAAAFLFGAMVLESHGSFDAPAWLVFLGDASYSIYLAHFMVISGAARFSYAHWRQLPIPIGIWMIVLFLCGTTAGIVTHIAIERPILRALGKRPANASPVATQ